MRIVGAPNVGRRRKPNSSAWSWSVWTVFFCHTRPSSGPEILS